MKGYLYILECSNGKFYTGSTKNLYLRLRQHQNGLGANYTRKHGPVKLVYIETFNRIDVAFYREKQIQGWTHIKKMALIQSRTNELHPLSECKNNTHFKIYRSLSVAGVSSS
jgi:putative endonuclease